MYEVEYRNIRRMDVEYNINVSHFEELPSENHQMASLKFKRFI